MYWKKIIFSLLLILSVFFIVILKLKNTDKKSIAPVEIKTPKIIEDTPVIKKTPGRSLKKTVFKSNEEIREEYGRLEKVYLRNGQNYIGAVIETNKIYKMITVDGLKIFPLSELKLREIIR